MKRSARAAIPYRGCVILRNMEPGYRLPYTSLTPGGLVAADTLAGIRELIRDKTQKK